MRGTDSVASPQQAWTIYVLMGPVICRAVRYEPWTVAALFAPTTASSTSLNYAERPVASSDSKL